MEDSTIQHDETMKDVKDIMEKSLNDVVNTIKKEEEKKKEGCDSGEVVETNSKFIHLGISLGFISAAIGVYLLKN